LDDAAQTLSTDDDVVLALPISGRAGATDAFAQCGRIGIARDGSHPTGEGTSFSTEEVTSDFEVIETS